MLYRSNIPPIAWFYAMLLFGNSSIGVRASFLRRQMGLGVKSTARLCNLIRLHMAAMDRPEQVGGRGKTVYIDEALLPFVKVGEGTEKRRAPAIVIGLACDDRLISGIIANRSRKTIDAVINQRVAPGSTIISDGHASYKRLRSQGWDHLVVNHSVAFHDFRGNTLNPIETYWRVLKRTLSGYGLVDEGNLWLYLAEIEFRYNRRRAGRSAFEYLIERFPRIDNVERSRLQSLFDWRSAHGPRGPFPAEGR